MMVIARFAFERLRDAPHALSRMSYTDFDCPATHVGAGVFLFQSPIPDQQRRSRRDRPDPPERAWSDVALHALGAGACERAHVAGIDPLLHSGDLFRDPSVFTQVLVDPLQGIVFKHRVSFQNLDTCPHSL